MEDPKKQVSIKDIAAISGVSIATVSRVLNKKGRYSSKTEQKVMAVANSCGYISNMAAKSLRETKSRTVGLIVPNVNNVFFSNLAYYIETFLFERNYSVFICNSGNSGEKEAAYFRALTGKGVDGIVCISTLDQLPGEILARDTPIVCIDRRPRISRPVPWVGNDGFLAGRMAAEHLLDKGCRHILFISSYLGSYDQHDRREGYIRALTDRGIFVDKNYILNRPGEDPTQIEVEVLVYQFLKTGLPLDGIITASEPAALGAMYALNSAGMSVPGDVRIVGFDNTLYSLLTTPPLSSMERHPQQMAVEACTLLLRLIAGEEPEEMEVTVPVSLVERGSSH